MRLTALAAKTGLTSAIAALGLAAPALAADPVPFEPAPVVDVEPTPQRSVLLGIGATVAPLYEGSDEYRVAPFPIIAPDLGGDGPRRFEFRALDDIRLHAVRFGGLSVGPLAGYRFGREEDDAELLRGLGDVDGGVVLGGFVGYDFLVSENASFGADVAVSTQVTGDAFDDEALAFAGLTVPVRRRVEDNYGYGYTIDFGVSGDVDLSPRLNLATRVGAEYASEEYMRTYFGVNQGQSDASAAAVNGGTRVPVFGVGTTPQFADDIGGQVKNVYVNANLTYDVTDSFQVRAGAGYSHLLGDASDSPISVTDHQFTGSLGVAYRIRF